MKNLSKLIKLSFLFLLIIIIAGGIYLKSSGVLYIIDKVYSPDKATKLIVYDYNKLSANKEEVIEIKRQYNTETNNKSYSFSGKYAGIYWTSDSSKYALKVKDYLSNIYLVDGNSGNITGIDMGLDLLLQNQINDDSDRFNFEIDKEFYADYEFIKWEKNNEDMLISYEFKDLDKNVHNGYFIYNYNINKIKGIFESIK